MPRKKQDNHSRTTITTQLRNDLKRELAIQAAAQGTHIYSILEEALMDYFVKTGVYNKKKARKS